MFAQMPTARGLAPLSYRSTLPISFQTNAMGPTLLWYSLVARQAIAVTEKYIIQPHRAKRMECVQLAGAFVRGWRFESGSKLHALHTLRDFHAGSLGTRHS